MTFFFFYLYKFNLFWLESMNRLQYYGKDIMYRHKYIMFEVHFTVCPPGGATDKQKGQGKHR